MKEKKPSRPWPQWIRAAIFALAATVLVVFARRLLFHKEPVNAALIADVEKRKNNPANIRIDDSCVALLQTADLVLRRGDDITSTMLSMLNSRDKTYSHCGLVIVEEGYPFVYHSIGGEDNPNGILQRDSAGKWFSPANNLAFAIARYDVDSIQKLQLASVTRSMFDEKREFDMKFDLTTDDKLYCAEFVYKAVNKALVDSAYLRPVIFYGHRFVGVDDLYLNSHAHLVCQTRYK